MSLLGDGPVPPFQGPLWILARHFGIYSIGAALSLICSLALLPVYATQFSPGNFGIVVTGQVIAVLAATVARLGIGIGMFRYLAVYHARGSAQAEDAIVTTCMAASLVCGLIATSIMLLGLKILGSGVTAVVQLTGILIALNVTLSAPREIAELALRAKQRAGAYVWLSSSFLILSTLFTVGLAIASHGSVASVFIAILIANGITSSAGLYMLRTHLSRKVFSGLELKRSLRFGVPSLPALLADWVMQYSDRFFLTRFAGLAQVGVYSMGYRIGLIEQQVLGTAIQAAWDPFVLRSYGEETGSRAMGRGATYFAIAGMALVVLISASAQTIFTIVHARPEYFAATPIVFLIALASFFGMLQGLFLAPTSIQLRPEFGTLVRALGAFINVGLNFLLIPTFGILGAAWATVVTFVISAVATELLGRRLWRIAYEYRRLVLIVVGGLITLVGIYLAQQAKFTGPVGLEPILAESIFIAWLFLTRILSTTDVAVVVQSFRRAAGSSSQS